MQEFYYLGNGGIPTGWCTVFVCLVGFFLALQKLYRTLSVTFSHVTM